ncbi:MAG TPA: DsbE family thiol:disulfide interchange protein, partial [Burkholderiales bacterium]|nr:DsbE family thiol:disulfide interchange protein [Burkholderiales bacterium]
MMRYALPLGIFFALVVLLAVGLNLDPREVPSPLIDKPAPMFQLPELREPQRTFSPKDLTGKVWMLNVWASWCVACREEHPVLLEFAKTGAVPVYGLNYKDQRADGIAWLQRFGDPYKLSAFDEQGRVGIDYGVYGVPETFIIDKNGVI